MREVLTLFISTFSTMFAIINSDAPSGPTNRGRGSYKASCGIHPPRSSMVSRLQGSPCRHPPSSACASPARSLSTMSGSLRVR
jgi:hypothetical protein